MWRYSAGVLVWTLIILGNILSVACTVDFSASTGSRCGNAILEQDEDCDATLLGGESCISLGYRGGQLGCSPECKLDLGDCEQKGYCGNQRLEADFEQCDGEDHGAMSCASLGLGPGVLTCDASCMLDSSNCMGICGDGVSQPELDEVCDGTDLAGETCEGLGYQGGLLACAADCAEIDTAGCIQQANGEPCTQDAQCIGGICWSEQLTGWPGGFCTQDCAVDGCPAGEECVEWANGAKYCYPGCSDFLDCRQGYGCLDRWLAGVGYCYAHCLADDECPGTGVCNVFNNLCGPPVGGEDFGGPCSAGTQCLGGGCLSSWPGGYCVSMCELSNNICPVGTACLDSYSHDAADLGLCLLRCVNNADCPRSGYSCQQTPFGTDTVCWPN